jgi:serine/threonine protein kinase
MEWAGPKKLGRYECDERLGGEGGLETYRARVRGLAGFDRLFAVKVLRLRRSDNAIALTDAFTKAAKRSASIDEPRIARVVDTDSADGMVFAVTEFIRGLDLGQFREQARAAGVFATGASEDARHWYELVAYVGAEVARGLATAHGLSSPWAHGGLGPGNVFVNVRGGIKLLDYGVRVAACRSGEPRSKRLATYSAPELVVSGDASPEADVYALGAILCELATGEPPPQSGRSADVESALTEVPDQLATTIAQLLSLDPGDRPLAAVAAEGLAAGYEGATEGALVTALVSLVRRFSESAAQATNETSAASAEVSMPQAQPPTRQSGQFPPVGKSPLPGPDTSLEMDVAPGDPALSASGEFTDMPDERTNAAEPELLASLVARSRPTDALRVPTDSIPTVVPVTVPKPAPRNPTMIAFGNQPQGPMATTLGGSRRRPAAELPRPAGTLPRLSPLLAPPPVKQTATAPQADQDGLQGSLEGGLEAGLDESLQHAFLLDEPDNSAPNPEVALEASPANWGARALAALGGQAGIGSVPAANEPTLEGQLTRDELPPSLETATASFADLPTVDELSVEPALAEEPPRVPKRSSPSFSTLPALDEPAFGPAASKIPDSFNELPAIPDLSAEASSAALDLDDSPVLAPTGFAPAAVDVPGFVMDSVEEPAASLPRDMAGDLEAQAYDDRGVETEGTDGEPEAYAELSLSAAPEVEREGLLEDELVDGPSAMTGAMTDTPVAPEAAAFTRNDAFARTLALNPEAVPPFAEAHKEEEPEPQLVAHPSPSTPAPATPTPKPRLAAVRRTARLDGNAVAWGDAAGAPKHRRWLLVGAVLGLTVVGGGALAGYLAGTKKKPPVAIQSDRPSKTHAASNDLATDKPQAVPAKPEQKPVVAVVPAKPEQKPVVAMVEKKATPPSVPVVEHKAAPEKKPVPAPVAAIKPAAAPVKIPAATPVAPVVSAPTIEKKPDVPAARARDDRGGTVVSISVNSSPDGAAVWINGQERGRTPLSLKIKSGAARVVLVKAGFLSATADVQASEGTSVTKTLQAVAPPMEGEARFRAECASAGKLPIVVDGKETGVLCPFTKMRVSPGIHRIGLFIPALGTVHDKEVHLPAGVRSVVFTD